ncbi:NF038104 family lipoprotein [Alkanindiges illinoisensis]|uniref:NF038104 family lipoprotein n=1 Tax=Alkanindiges illinoisensis TaxID=197183 RepID=UPI000550E194|nr:NF038104 family lipoprotein [Alkanindiges illinoisensis]
MKLINVLTLLTLALGLQACLGTKVVTVPVKVAYGTTKAVVKGTGAVVGAAIPDDDDEQKE